MKKVWKVSAIVALLAVMLTASIASACPAPPEVPVCGEGEITLEDAQWVSPVYEEQCEWVKHTWWWLTWYTWECEDVLISEGYWIDPVCYLPCSETVADSKVYGDWYQIGDDHWNEWVEDGDTRTRTGYKLMARDWTQNIYDAQDSELICDVNEGTQKYGQLVKENEEAPCIGMYKLSGHNYPCFLSRNPETDSPWDLPERFDGTGYMYALCGTVYHCDSISYNQTFKWTGEWEFVCDWGECELDCP